MAKRRTWMKTGSGILAAAVLAGCGSGAEDGSVALNSSGDDELEAVSPSPTAPSGAAYDSDSPSIVAGEAASPSTDDGTSAGVPRADTPPAGSLVPGVDSGNAQAGTLTAGVWDDSRNFDRFLEYRAELEQRQMAGMPQFDIEAQRTVAESAASLTSHATLDIALVIDTTGSMGDELRYLQTEFDALSSSIDAEYPDAEQRWALIVYRDQGDLYVTRSYDFEAESATFREQLRYQSAGGGGDYPEASDAALEAMNQLGWRSGEGNARLVFWVADAPHHEQQSEALSAAVQVAASQDVHLYPVASSGVDELTEYTMRAAAQLTRGRYLFLTDDSGVGGAHKEPTIPCYFVTRLDTAILRMVDIEMSGVYREPAAADVIRAGGDPADGACALQSGQTAFVF
jgi:hypothetical protein